MGIAQSIKAADKKAGRFYATGKRKNAIARVWLTRGKGLFTVNGETMEKYFARPIAQLMIMQPLQEVEAAGKFDINVSVLGGGKSGQAGAVRHGIAKALTEVDEANRPPLKKRGFLTRDARVVERKKYGKRKARRSFQFSKR